MASSKMRQPQKKEIVSKYGGYKNKLEGNKIMRNTNIENLLNEVSASKILGISATTLRTGYRYKGLIPFVQLKNKSVRYRPSDLQKFVESHLVKATK